MLQMLVDLGMDVYQDEFERSFLQTAAEAYQVQNGVNMSVCMFVAILCSCLRPGAFVLVVYCITMSTCKYVDSWARG